MRSRVDAGKVRHMRSRVDAEELRGALVAVAGWLDGDAPQPPREELARAVRLSLRALALLAAGATVEVRVPPFAAVQCVAGPRHTRGTPPNVVETDSRTWLELATARRSWSDALATGRIAASGSRADISPWLPLQRPPLSADRRRIHHHGNMTMSGFSSAMNEFDRRVRAIGPDQWHNPTPCTEWDVRALVNHLVTEQLWAPLLLDGATVEDVGDRFDGDQLGDDPVAAWTRAAAAAREAFAAPGALRGTVELSYGRRPAEGYCLEMTLDLAVHAWDLARGIEVDERLDEELVGDVLAFIEPQVDQLVSSGMFAPPVAFGDDADAQTRLLALLGRRV
jgi:uncharacterized protein (TIGR03086 family)